MNHSQRLVLVLVLLAASGVTAISVLVGEGTTPEHPALTGPGTPAAEVPGPPPPAPLRSGETGGVGRLNAQDAPAGSLKVRVVDQEGEELPEAELQLTSPAGDRLTALGSTTWRDLPVGEYRVKASLGDLLSFKEAVQVVDQQTTSVTARLGASLLLTGRVVDRFGQGVGPVPVWFLRRDQDHPATLKDGRKILSCLADSRGNFTLEIERTGNVRLSVGTPGNQLIEAPPQQFSSAGPRKVTVVVSGTGRLEVVLDQAPPGLAEGKVALGVTVLTTRSADGGSARRRRFGTGKRKKDKDDGETRDLDGGAKREEREEREERPADAGTPEPQDELPLVPRAAAEFDAKGVVSFEALPLDRDLVLELHRRSDRYRAEPVRLVPDQALVARVVVPARRTQEEREASDHGELVLAFQQQDLPADAPPVGVTWE